MPQYTPKYSSNCDYSCIGPPTVQCNVLQTHQSTPVIVIFLYRALYSTGPVRSVTSVSNSWARWSAFLEILPLRYYRFQY
ncbi:hypothetical protein DPMN_026119 [Dreissena polymorpha]|uniref:Uncharacterized protein n=1 Tax=Dreissena polymorpha TaxID=45954 RepID=A0A9D4LUK2_DREPO|nr:hypothetical protein DPMN_026119 [Dreissena polymorpha]